ncbi:MAG: hypothetical protein J6L96_03225, partial [Clostridia bacterium]|nr:hypothetical protein [Clostridia bacterium]
GDSPDTENNTEKETESQPPVTTSPNDTEKQSTETTSTPETGKNAEDTTNPPEAEKQPIETATPPETEKQPPDTTEVPETTEAPETTGAPETTAVPETEKLPDETIAPEAPKDDPNPGQIPEMAIESGYTVTETTNFNILVTEDKVKTSRTARVAALQNESGENALYLDVLTEDGKVMTSITWKGYYQMFVREDGLIVLMRLWMSPVTQRCTGIYQFFDVSDSKLSGYDVVELEIPEINAVPGEGKTINFAVRSPSEAARYELTFTDFIYSYQAEFDEDTLDGKSIYLIADSYLNPDKPVVYSDTDKVEFPNLEDKEIADKYTWEYASALFE